MSEGVAQQEGVPCPPVHVRLVARAAGLLLAGVAGPWVVRMVVESGRQLLWEFDGFVRSFGEPTASGGYWLNFLANVKRLAVDHGVLLVAIAATTVVVVTYAIYRLLMGRAPRVLRRLLGRTVNA